MNNIITLEKVIKRNDYKRLGENLKERVEELARIICDKAVELDIEKLLDYEICKYSSNLADEYKLVVYGEDEHYHSLHDINNEYYLHGDYTCRVIGASNAEALTFLNEARNLLTELDRIETQNAEAIQQALNKTENL
jgi:hypothetical protein